MPEITKSSNLQVALKEEVYYIFKHKTKTDYPFISKMNRIDNKKEMGNNIINALKFDYNEMIKLYFELKDEFNVIQIDFKPKLININIVIE